MVRLVDGSRIADGRELALMRSPSSDTEAIGHYSIALSIDGTPVQPSFTEFGSTDDNPDVVTKVLRVELPKRSNRWDAYVRRDVVCAVLRDVADMQ
jgi:hypothetical protein